MTTAEEVGPEAVRRELQDLRIVGDALAAAVERDHGLRHVSYLFEDCATQVCDAARAWRARRGAG